MSWFRRLLATWVRFEASPCGSFSEQSGNGQVFSPSTSVFASQYHSTKIPYSHEYAILPPTQYPIRNWQRREVKQSLFLLGKARKACQHDLSPGRYSDLGPLK
jgi:hypothetical protein